MWCLINNLSEGTDFRPFFDSPAFNFKLCNEHLSSYTQRHLDDFLLSGEPPYQVTSHYSDDLRQLIRACLPWDPADRISVEELKAHIDTVREAEDPEERDILNMYIHDGSEAFELGKQYVGKKRKRDDGDQSSSEIR